MCTVATKRARGSEASMESINKRTKKITVKDELVTAVPSSPVDVCDEVDEGATSSECEAAPVLPSNDLNLEVKLMQGSVNEMQATVNMAAARISELRALLSEYAKTR